MMKTLLGILYLALFCVGTMAQNPVTTAQDLKQNLVASGEYITWSAGHSEIKGSPYLTEEFLPGMIHWNGMWNEGFDIRYNIYQGTFEAKLERGIIAIDPIKNNIDTINYREEVFVKKYLEEGKDKLVVYLSLLGQQNGFALYKQYRITLTEAVTDTDLYHKAKPAEYKTQNPVYYVFRDNEHWTVKGSKTLAEIFQIDPKVVKRYLKDNKYKLSQEEDLLEAVLYFSSLISLN
ncbi:MAG: hypothetical protein U9R49_14260 [Bacteroidota bacterium]|nr:hypothetical protein [Bacteroidota bacterium]